MILSKKQVLVIKKFLNYCIKYVEYMCGIIVESILFFNKKEIYDIKSERK